MGVSFLGTLTPLRGGYGYAAFKAVRPNEEPSELVDLLYYQIYLLAIGVQEAGPHLNPETFNRAMYAYPGGSGLVGTWKFEPGRYTPTVDAREIWCDPEKVSVQNNQKGAYVEAEPGKRYRPGQFPAGEPPSPSGDGPPSALPGTPGDPAQSPLAAALRGHVAARRRPPARRRPQGHRAAGHRAGQRHRPPGRRPRPRLPHQPDRQLRPRVGGRRGRACRREPVPGMGLELLGGHGRRGRGRGALGGLLELLVIRRFARSSRSSSPWPPSAWPRPWPASSCSSPAGSAGAPPPASPPRSTCRLHRPGDPERVATSSSWWPCR